MNDTISGQKLKWETPGDPTRFQLHYPPARAPRKTQQWDNWVAAMMMDTPLNSTDRAILTRLAMHYNLKTGDCFPAVKRLGIEAGLGEGGWRTVQRTISKAVQLGWIERTMRAGGPIKKNQTNLYELTLPQPICDLLASIGYRPPGPGQYGYKYPTSGERHDKTGVPTRQNGGTDPANNPPITGKYYNREVIEPSVSKDTASFASRSEAHRKQEVGERALRAREDASLPRPLLETEYAEPFEVGDVEYIQNLILSEVGWGSWMTIQKIVAMCREPGVYEYYIDGRQLAAMAKAGYLGRRGDHVWVDRTRKLAPGVEEAAE